MLGPPAAADLPAGAARAQHRAGHRDHVLRRDARTSGCSATTTRCPTSTTSLRRCATRSPSSPRRPAWRGARARASRPGEALAWRVSRRAADRRAVAGGGDRRRARAAVARRRRGRRARGGPGERVDGALPGRARAGVTRDRAAAERGPDPAARWRSATSCSRYPGARPPAALRELQDELDRPVRRRDRRRGPGGDPGRAAARRVEALAWGRRLRARTPEDPALRTFAEAWLGQGAPEPCATSSSRAFARLLADLPAATAALPAAFAAVTIASAASPAAFFASPRGPAPRSAGASRRPSGPRPDGLPWSAVPSEVPPSDSVPAGRLTREAPRAPRPSSARARTRGPRRR